MQIYFSHSTAYDFHNELYLPVKSTDLTKKHRFIFPHEKNNVAYNSHATIANCDLIIAEVSYPSTGQGIELGWANKLNKPIFCIYQTDKKISSSLKIISDQFFAYADSKAMLAHIEHILM